MKLLFIVPTPLHHRFVSHAQTKTMFLCLAICFSAYTFRFSCIKIFEIFFLQNFLLLNTLLLKRCGSLTTAVQGGAFSFSLSIPFTALPMHCCCTIYQADPGSFCFGGPRRQRLSNPKTLTTTLVANIQIKRISCTIPFVGGRLCFVTTRGCFRGRVINPSAFLRSGFWGWAWPWWQDIPLQACQPVSDALPLAMPSVWVLVLRHHHSLFH